MNKDHGPAAAERFIMHQLLADRRDAHIEVTQVNDPAIRKLLPLLLKLALFNHSLYAV